ncbi:hypothetical protein F4604DRAFT_1765676 [Suillus subluteus]|nr:hypothetical protein F4604DRAFT_1765676 [Suillus subluteus]
MLIMMSSSRFSVSNNFLIVISPWIFLWLSCGCFETPVTVNATKRSSVPFSFDDCLVTASEFLPRAVFHLFFQVPESA